MTQENNCRQSKRNLPDVRLLDEEQLFKAILTPEENFMPQEIWDYLRQANEEWKRREQVREENRQKRKRGPSKKLDPALLAKQGSLSF